MELCCRSRCCEPRRATRWCARAPRAAPSHCKLTRPCSRARQLVELKNGETFNGTLDSCDNWMNIKLKEVICTSRDGDRFWRLPEVVIRGNNIK